MDFIIFLVCSKRQLRTKTNAFVVSLAVADFCVGVSVVPSLFFYEMTSGRDAQDLLPGGISIVRWLFMDASVANLCSLVLDRYVAIVKPLKYLTFMTDRRVILMISFSWGITIVFILFEASFWLSSKSPLILNIFIWLAIIFFEFLPCFMLILCVTSMLCAVRKHHRAAHTLAKQLRFNHHVSLRAYEKSAVLMMAVVVGFFLGCYGISLRCGFLRISNVLCNDFKYHIPMLVLNSAVNPLAYAFFKRDIKKEFKILFYKGILKNDDKVFKLRQSFSSR